MNKKGYIDYVIVIALFLIIVGFVGMLGYNYHVFKIKHYDTYVEVSKDLNEANRCLYQCGFNYPSSVAFENYKFCSEKCDRINERNCEPIK